MSYKFCIINYADQNLPGLVSNHLVEENRNQLAQILHLNDYGFIPINTNKDGVPDAKKDQQLLNKIEIIKNYNNLLSIKNYNNLSSIKNYNNLLSIKNTSNNLIWNRRFISTSTNKQKYLVAHTPLDENNKMSDNFEHCLGVLIAADNGTQKLSSLIHLPPYVLNSDNAKEYFDQIIQSYQNQIQENNLWNVECFIFSGSLERGRSSSIDDLKQDYNNGIQIITEILHKNNLSYNLITGPKGQGKECIIVETQKERVHIFRPRDDTTISYQTL